MYIHSTNLHLPLFEKPRFDPKDLGDLTGVTTKLVSDWRVRGLAPYGTQQDNSYWVYSIHDVAAMAATRCFLNLNMPLQWAIDAGFESAQFFAFHVLDDGPARSGSFLYITDWNPKKRTGEAAQMISTLCVYGLREMSDVLKVREEFVGSPLGHIVFIADVVRTFTPKLISEIRSGWNG